MWGGHLVLFLIMNFKAIGLQMFEQCAVENPTFPLTRHVDYSTQQLVAIPHKLRLLMFDDIVLAKMRWFGCHMMLCVCMLWCFLLFSSLGFYVPMCLIQIRYLNIMNEWIRTGTPAKHAFPVCLRFSVHLRAVCKLLVVMEGERCPLGTLRQRWTCVWNVATQQDAESRRVKKLMLDVVFLRLLISLPSCQLPEECESLRILLLHSVFFRCAPGLHQLPGTVATYIIINNVMCNWHRDNIHTVLSFA